tara:strand:- start:566 stop:1105 length:540 start_codon:yes stop_codon:yes gene_type:complete
MEKSIVSQKTATTIFLLGFMASGKSSYGRKAAKRLELPFIDLDAEIEKKMGMSIPELFQKQGEQAFRAIEFQTLSDLLPQSGIISLGGGTVCNQDVWDLLKGHGLTVFLDMPFEQCLGRLRSSNKDRPLAANLEDKEAIDTLRALYQTRQEIYHLADHKVDFPYDHKSLANSLSSWIKR